MSEEEVNLYSACLADCYNKEPSEVISRIAFNYKEWEKDRGKVLQSFCRNSNNRYLNNPDVELIPIGEELNTLEGSGCAIINTIKESINNNKESQKTLALLAAGEGSRLWGVSASNGFVKALTKLFSSTLFEQTVDQCIYLFSQAPNEGKDMTIIAGTDNILLPSQNLQTIDGRKFKDVKNGNLFFFSKEVKVLDDSDNIIDINVLPFLEQLGIMIVDSETSFPIEFMEKVKKNIILDTLKRNNKKSVFFNAFIFSCTSLACKTLWEIYSQPLIDNSSILYYECKDFDWSSHIIEPLAILGSNKSKEEKINEWKTRWNDKQKKIFSNESDWLNLLLFAERFISICGHPVVINLGSDAIWYDTGMCKDVYQLHQDVVCNDMEKRNITRKLLSGIPKDHFNPTIDNLSISSDSLVVNSTFKNGGVVGNKCVIVDCFFEENVNIPDGSVIIGSKFCRLSFVDSISCVLIYCYKGNAEDNGNLLIEHNNSVYCSFNTLNDIINCCFPLDVVPKDKSQCEYFNHYHKGDNYAKSFLDQTILGSSFSFRDLQKKKIPSLSF